MTLKEFLDFKGWTVEDAKYIFKGFWGDGYFNNLDKKISNFEVFCEYPFWKLNQIYNEFYHKDDDIGSTYDWLEDDATEDVINQYLGKED